MSETIVKLKVDDADPALARRLWFVFFLLAATVYGLAILTPKPILYEGARNLPCPTNVYNELGYRCLDLDIDKNPVFHVQIENMLAEHQFITLEGFPGLLPRTTDVRRAYIQLEVSIFGLGGDGQIRERMVLKQTKAVEHECTFDGGQNVCSTQQIATIRDLKHPRYVFVIRFNNKEQLENNSVSEYSVAFIFGDKNYTYFILALRYTLFGISILYVLNYYFFIKKMDKKHVGKEQNMLLNLGLLAIFFNDPFYFLTLLKGHYYASLFSTFAVVAFTSYLIYYWLYMLEKISDEGDLSKSKSVMIKIYSFIFFFVGLVCYYHLTMDTMEDPFLDWKHDDHSQFAFAKFIFTWVCYFGAAWIGVRAIYLSWRLSALNERSGTFLLFSILTMACYIIFILTGTLQVFSENQIRQVLFFGLTNLYVGLMLYLYTPPKEGEMEMVQINKGEDETFEDEEKHHGAGKKGKIQDSQAEHMGDEDDD